MAKPNSYIDHVKFKAAGMVKNKQCPITNGLQTCITYRCMLKMCYHHNCSLCKPGELPKGMTIADL